MGGLLADVRKGRKWFYVDVPWMEKSRFSLASGSLESEYSQNTRCWKSKEEYDEACLHGVLWEQIQRWFRNNYSGPDKITKEQMYDIAKIVGIELSETPGDCWRR